LVSPKALPLSVTLHRAQELAAAVAVAVPHSADDALPVGGSAAQKPAITSATTANRT
jgi:hypothetical protein